MKKATKTNPKRQTNVRFYIFLISRLWLPRIGFLYKIYIIIRKLFIIIIIKKYNLEWLTSMIFYFLDNVVMVQL